MHLMNIVAITCYFFILFLFSYQGFQKNTSSSDFIIGNRSLNYWLTALAAHASDMSSWLFLGYPALIFTQGLFGVWTAIGLIICMYLNWVWIAPQIRVMTEKYQCLTFSSYFESHLKDHSGIIRLFSALILMVFYTVYISASLTGMGELIRSLFHVDYVYGVLLGILLVIPYVFIGGYRMLAWIDLYQGCFLLGVILIIPIHLFHTLLNSGEAFPNLTLQNLTKSLFPDFSAHTWISMISMTFGWGLGYFGQPHILTKFMGINDVRQINKSKWIGMGWMTLSLGGATCIGLIATIFFRNQAIEPERVFLEMVQSSFQPFTIGIILCAVLGATMNAMSSQILVMASSFSEDFYKRLFRPHASSQELILVSRIGITLSALIAFLIAFHKNYTIYNLVQYAWSGIGSSFGPLIFLSLYSKQVNKYGAWSGILGGGATSALWPYMNSFFESTIAPMIPGIAVGLLLIIGISYLTTDKQKVEKHVNTEKT